MTLYYIMYNVHIYNNMLPHLSIHSVFIAIWLPITCSVALPALLMNNTCDYWCKVAGIVLHLLLKMIAQAEYPY